MKLKIKFEGFIYVDDSDDIEEVIEVEKEMFYDDPDKYLTEVVELVGNVEFEKADND